MTLRPFLAACFVFLAALSSAQNLEERRVANGTRFFAVNEAMTTTTIVAPTILTAPPTLGSGYLAISQLQPASNTSNGTTNDERRGPVTARNAVIVFFGTDAANETFVAELIGYRRIQSPGVATFWIPVPLGQFTVTLGTTSTGTASETFGDTIVAVANTDTSEYRIEANATGAFANYVGRLVLTDTEGLEFLRLRSYSSSAATANAILWLE